MPTIQEIAQDIIQRAKARGVDPNLALGIASREGLIPRVINSPTFGNPDAKGYSYGPWQLYSGSPTPGAVAGGGQAAQFTRQYGARPSANNWREQNQFAIDLMSRLSPQQRSTTWYAIPNAGGEAAISRMGAQFAARLGVTGNGAPVAVAAAQPGQGGGDTIIMPEAPPPPPADVYINQESDGYDGGMSAPAAGSLAPQLDELSVPPMPAEMEAPPVEDPASAKWATIQQQKAMGARPDPAEFNLANVFQGADFKSIGTAKDMPSMRKTNVG
jgi:hypothetical protein